LGNGNHCVGAWPAPFFWERAVQIVGHTHIVLIEDTKDERCEFTGIALRKELFVDFDEALEKAGRGESKREGGKRQMQMNQLGAWHICRRSRVRV